MTTPRVLIGDALDAAGVVGLGQVAPDADVAKAFRYLDQIASQWSRRQWLPQPQTGGFGGIPETGLVDLDTDVGLTPDFDAALTYALAVRLRPAYQLPPDEALVALLTDAIEVIRKSNTETPAGSTPRDLVRLAMLAAGAIKPGQISPMADTAEAYTLVQQLAAQWARRQFLATGYVLPALDTATGLGPEFNAALVSNLAVRLRSNYALPPDEALQAQAEASLEIIRKSNTEASPTGAVRDIIGQALRAAGAIKPGQVAPVADTSEAYGLLQQIAAQWTRKQYLPTGYALPAIDADTGLGADFRAALLYALAVRLRPNYGLAPDEWLAAEADDALATVRKTAAQAETGHTPRDLVALAMRVAGALKPGQVVPNADGADAYAVLQQMVGQWARKRWLVPHLADLVLPLTGGVGSYAIGPGGDLDTARPDRIEAAYLRNRPGALNPLDWPVTVLDDREDWNRIQLKAMRGWPAVLFYDSGFPLGTLNLYPTPNLTGAWELHLSVKAGVGAFAGLDAPLNLPPEYEAALLYNLAARLRPHYGLPPDATITAMARDALNTLRQANTQVPRLRMPASLPGVRRGVGAGAWWAGLVGGGGDPGFNEAQRFRVGISLLGGTDIIT